MNSLVTYLRLLLLTVSGMLILCITFASNPEFADGVKSGKIFWFYSTVLLFAGSIIFSELTLRKPTFKLSLPDILVIAILIFLLITYDWKLNPNPEKLFFIVQSFLVWFMLRSALTAYHSLRMFYLSIIMCTGAIEAIWGMIQLYDLAGSNHSLFKMTGSFFNPGPFSGYLAVVLPISLGMILKLQNCKKTAWWQMRTILYYFSWICFLLILMVLPAGMSRSAWLAAGISCVWVFWKYKIGWEKVKHYWNNSRKLFITFSFISIIAIGVSLIALYNLKKDSANGRLLMWKVTTHVIAEKPLIGNGLASFPACYAKAQAAYFINENATSTEKMVAGCPQYAFNEYLHFCSEHGIIGFLLFMTWMFIVIYLGIKNKRYSMVGGLISLGIFALASYPLQMPSFWVLLIFLSAMVISGPRIYRFKKLSVYEKAIPYIGSVAAIFSIAIYVTQMHYPEVYKKWLSAQMLYHNKAYEIAIDKYAELYDQLNHRSDFLFESAQCLSNCGRYEEANQLLERATFLSGDPMIHYIIAKNQQQMGMHEEAEKRYHYAISILPERIYPYYLLTKLYSDPLYFNKEKLQWAADSVMYKTPKVESTAIREMRDEVKKLLATIK